MKEMWRELFIYLWEVFTGVFDDIYSRVLRFLIFTLLAAGIFWSAFNYMNIGMNADNIVYTQNDIKIEKRRVYDLTDQVRAISAMRSGGTVLARSMRAMNRYLFNKNEQTAPQKYTGDTKPPAIAVRAVLISGKNNLALIDTEYKKSTLVRQGENIPDLKGRVIKIMPDGIVLKWEGQNVIYKIK